MSFTTNASEAMRIDSSGNVGIGCTPTATSNVTTLEVSNATTARILVDSTGTGGRKYGWYSSTDGQFAVFDYDASAERLRIDTSGNLLVGKTSSADLITGAEFRQNGRIGSTMNTNSSSSESYILRSSSDNTYKFYVAMNGQIHATSTSITGLSDERLKENITDLDTGLSEVMELKPRRFDWKDGTDTNVAGFVAQELESILPDLIGDYKHEELEDAKAVRMGDMIPTLVKAIQEQQELINNLTARIEQLEN